MIFSYFVASKKMSALHLINISIVQNAARLTVPGGPSVACSTAKAVEWDAAWSKLLDPSGRAALGVHDAAYEDTPEKVPASSVDPITEDVFRPAHVESLVPAAAV
jgi:asparagine synthase (glutamine-hydrolysing)